MTVPSYWPSSNNRIAIVAEAPGQTEETQGQPLVGASGILLNSVLNQAGINHIECFKTNVFDTRPPGNDVGTFCVDKKTIGRGYSLPPLGPGQYVKHEHLQNLSRLCNELTQFNPNVIFALGNTAIWALLHRTGIKKLRGAVANCVLVPGLKVVPSYHPAAVLRAYDLRVVLVADALKVAQESLFPETRRKARTLYVPETVKEAEQLFGDLLPSGTLCSVDIETRGGTTLTCIGFAPTNTTGFVIPFWHSTRPGNHYWQKAEDELQVYKLVRKCLQDPSILKLGQNFVGYDIWFMAEKLKIFTQGWLHDTMFQAHALQPEMDKDLGFLASIHCDEPAYKLFRPRGQATEKRDE